jgi:hypothetical protein
MDGDENTKKINNRARAPSRTDPRAIKDAILRMLPSSDLHLLKKLLLDDGMSLVHNLVNLVSFEQSREEELVELLASFFEQCNRLPLLLRWSVRHEVDSTDCSEDLFRKESFVTQLLFRYFFNASGLRYLKATVGPLIADICDAEANSLEIEPDSATLKLKPEICERNMSFLFGRTAKFFERLNDTLTQCPLIIRRGFCYLQKEVSQKFPNSESVVPVVLFLRYLCPTILQPHTYGLAKSPPKRDSLKALVIVSKLIQNTANGIVKNNIAKYSKHEPKIMSFIERHINDIKKFCDSLTDESQIATLESQQIPQQHNTIMSPKNDTLKRILSFIMEATKQIDSSLSQKEQQNRPVQTAEEECELSSERQERLKFLQKDLNSRSWQISKLKEGYKLFLKKSRNSQEKRLVAFKVEGTMNITLETLLSYVNHLTPKDWALLHPNIVPEQSHLLWSSPSSDVQKWKLQVKFPFPFHDRELCFVRYVLCNSSHEALVVCFPCERTLHSSPNKNIVKTQMELMIVMKSTVDDPTHCFVIFTFNIDPKGQFPKPIKRTMSRSFLEACLNLRNMVECRNRRTTSLCDTAEKSRQLLYKYNETVASSVRSRSVSFGTGQMACVRFHNVDKTHPRTVEPTEAQIQDENNKKPISSPPFISYGSQSASSHDIRARIKLRRLSVSHVPQSGTLQTKQNKMNFTHNDKKRASLPYERTKLQDLLFEDEEAQLHPKSGPLDDVTKITVTPRTPHHTQFLEYLEESLPSSTSAEKLEDHGEIEQPRKKTSGLSASSNFSSSINSTSSATSRYQAAHNTIRNPVKKLKLQRRLSEGAQRRRHGEILSDNSDVTSNRHEIRASSQFLSQTESLGSSAMRQNIREERQPKATLISDTSEGDTTDDNSSHPNLNAKFHCPAPATSSTWYLESEKLHAQQKCHNSDTEEE